MAQLVEQRIRNAWVTGSSPVFGSFNSEDIKKEQIVHLHYLLFLYPIFSYQLLSITLPTPRYNLIGPSSNTANTVICSSSTCSGTSI